MRHEESHDPYAPPPRHRDKSGRVVRVVLVAALLGAAVWGYTQYDNSGPGLIAEAPLEEQQTLADTSLDDAPAPPLTEPASAPASDAETPPTAPPPAGR